MTLPAVRLTHPARPTSHRVRGLVDDPRLRSEEVHHPRHEPLRHLVAVHAPFPSLTERLADVRRQVPGNLPRLSESGRASGQIADQLDMDEPVRPRLLDVRAPDEPAHREVHMEPMPFGMPLRHP